VAAAMRGAPSASIALISSSRPMVNRMLPVQAGLSPID
jgi:hypothetical protein